MASQKGPLKVFLWSAPRSVSTTFLKCMTFVQNAVAWHEPYLQISKFSHKIDNIMSSAEPNHDLGSSKPNQDLVSSKPYHDLVEKHGGASAVVKIASGFDASDKDIDWLKEQLEADFPGKRLVFVKEIARVIETRYDKIPMGFRHTFLIRNPQKVMMSAVKGFMQNEPWAANAFTSQEHAPDMGIAKSSNMLWKYVKSQHLESCPVIIDAEDLLENPKEILEAYCKEVGIPFTEDLLTWEAGDDVMTKHWMVPKQTILTFRAMGAHEGTFASTGFKQPAPPASKSGINMEQIMKQIPPKMVKDMKEMMGRDLPYYEEMYAQRLTVHK